MTKEFAKRQTELEVKWVSENAQHPAVRGARADPDGFMTVFHKAVVDRLDWIKEDPDKLKMLADIFDEKPSRIRQWIDRRTYKLRFYGGFDSTGCLSPVGLDPASNTTAPSRTGVTYGAGPNLKHMPIQYVSLKDQRSLIHKVSLQSVLLNGPSVMIPLPDPAAGLTVQMQRGGPVLWYLFSAEDAATIRDREVICVGTGVPFRSDIKAYLGTFQIGDLVHHYFLVGK